MTSGHTMNLQDSAGSCPSGQAAVVTCAHEIRCVGQKQESWQFQSHSVEPRGRLSSICPLGVFLTPSIGRPLAVALGLSLG